MGFSLVLNLESILADGTMLPPQAEFSVHCRWWHLSHWDWIVRMSSAPSQNTVRQTTAEECKYEISVWRDSLDDHLNRLLMPRRLFRMCAVFQLLCLTRKHGPLAEWCTARSRCSSRIPKPARNSVDYDEVWSSQCLRTFEKSSVGISYLLQYFRICWDT